MAVIDAQTTAVTFENNASAAQTVGRKISLTGPGGSVTVKERTTLDDATYHVKAPGLIDPGQVELEVFHDLSDVGQAALDDAWDSRHTREMVMTLADASTMTFQCFVSANSGPVANVNGDITTTYTLEVTGEVVKA